MELNLYKDDRKYIVNARVDVSVVVKAKDEASAKKLVENLKSSITAIELLPIGLQDFETTGIEVTNVALLVEKEIGYRKLKEMEGK